MNENFRTKLLKTVANNPPSSNNPNLYREVKKKNISPAYQQSYTNNSKNNYTSILSGIPQLLHPGPQDFDKSIFFFKISEGNVECSIKMELHNFVMKWDYFLLRKNKSKERRE
jgi:hypothetical protein